MIKLKGAIRLPVIPAKAGLQPDSGPVWTPAYAGVTMAPLRAPARGKVDEVDGCHAVPASSRN